MNELTKREETPVTLPQGDPCKWHEGETKVGAIWDSPLCQDCRRILTTRQCPECLDLYLDWHSTRDNISFAAPATYTLEGGYRCALCHKGWEAQNESLEEKCELLRDNQKVLASWAADIAKDAARPTLLVGTAPSGQLTLVVGKETDLDTIKDFLKIIIRRLDRGDVQYANCPDKH